MLPGCLCPVPSVNLDWTLGGNCDVSVPWCAKNIQTNRQLRHMPCVLAWCTRQMANPATPRRKPSDRSAPRPPRCSRPGSRASWRGVQPRRAPPRAAAGLSATRFQRVPSKRPPRVGGRGVPGRPCARASRPADRPPCRARIYNGWRGRGRAAGGGRGPGAGAAARGAAGAAGRYAAFLRGWSTRFSRAVLLRVGRAHAAEAARTRGGQGGRGARVQARRRGAGARLSTWTRPRRGRRRRGRRR